MNNLIPKTYILRGIRKFTRKHSAHETSAEVKCENQYQSLSDEDNGDEEQEQELELSMLEKEEKELVSEKDAARIREQLCEVSVRRLRQGVKSQEISAKSCMVGGKKRRTKQDFSDDIERHTDKERLLRFEERIKN